MTLVDLREILCSNVQSNACMEPGLHRLINADEMMMILPPLYKTQHKAGGIRPADWGKVGVERLGQRNLR